MSVSFSKLNPRVALSEIARDFHTRGWMAGTAGNLSARADKSSFWITASGKSKGRLDEQDFVRVDIASGEVIDSIRDTNKPSAETAIHRAIYQLFSDAGACLHVHTIDACLTTADLDASVDHLRLPNIELLKGFNIWEQDPQIDLPLFENMLSVEAIAKNIYERFSKQSPPLTALMIKSHGMTVWGKDLQEAYNRVEAGEFIMSYLARKKKYAST
jgi:methylthioribulose-1-phosphate dehydratase